MGRRITSHIYHRNFTKSFTKLDSYTKSQFIERRNLLLIDPEHPLLNNHSLHGKLKGFRSINVTGDIRAVYKMEGFIAIFIDIGTHSELYDN